jgi:hypothetical protein
MVQTRSQTRKLQQIEEQRKMQKLEEQRQIEQQQVVEEQMKRAEMIKYLEHFGNNYDALSSWVNRSIIDDCDEFRIASGPLTRISIVASMFMKIAVYLPTLVLHYKMDSRWIRFAKIAYEKQCELYDEIYIEHKPKIFDQLCTLNQSIRAFQISQPIIRKLIADNLHGFILKDELEYKLYDVNDLADVDNN